MIYSMIEHMKRGKIKDDAERTGEVLILSARFMPHKRLPDGGSVINAKALRYRIG